MVGMGASEQLEVVVPAKGHVPAHVQLTPAGATLASTIMTGYGLKYSWVDDAGVRQSLGLRETVTPYGSLAAEIADKAGSQGVAIVGDVFNTPDEIWVLFSTSLTEINATVSSDYFAGQPVRILRAPPGGWAYDPKSPWPKELETYSASVRIGGLIGGALAVAGRLVYAGWNASTSTPGSWRPPAGSWAARRRA
jgi:hypothetical protein